MALTPQPYSSKGALQVSQLRPYSLGIVAADKPIKGDFIEVTPTETFTMLDGELDDAQTETTEQGVGYGGKEYSVTAKTSVSIKAEWLRLGNGNRRTAPNVKRGAEVVIWQFGDLDKFYWVTVKDDFKLRKLETVIFAFSGTKDEKVENGPGNSYFLEISTHKGLTTFHTSKANGEYCCYDIQINSKDGKVVIQDDIGNSFLLDSKAHQLRMENVDGSVIDLTRAIATITTADSINMKTKNYNLQADSGNMAVKQLAMSGDKLSNTTSNVEFTNSAFKVQSGNTDIS